VLFRFHRSLKPALLGVAASAVLCVPAVFAQGKLDARYTVSLAGIPLAKGAWVIDIADDHYSMAGSGMTTGLVKAVTGGEGSVAAQGGIKSRALNPQSYAVTMTTGKRTEQLQLSLGGGNVKDVSINPAPPPPGPGHVPVTDAHRRGVIDPFSAAIVQVNGSGDVMTPDACNRRVAVFDGRMRYELEFAFKRLDQVKAEQGYRGPVLVCSVQFSPVAGHNPDRAAIKFLVRQREMEVALAPVSGTRMLVPFRFSVPTPLGQGILQATQFVSIPQPSKASVKPQ
jgi:hypothetical protein